ncbi:hypothetical protein [Natronoglomus mannanivorans]|uniref:Uncharacterized protein n=1 Tax=Natronoglomus mannanivorans TaxID=2979990 RepID=A0AAP3E546_9EURY|nr:hypothetical protein [Halobacteria archaeon AArc-xg1-1]
MADDLPDTVDKLDDQMDLDQYRHPPGLMPESDPEFSQIEHDDVLGIYQKGDTDRWMKSDIYLYAFQ